MNTSYAKVRDQLNQKGCGFCLAKWTQVTIHLQMGQTHSCHHPNTHKIPVAEIKRNPSALHNTRFKKQKRKEMLENRRPHECDYCWNVEDNSDRFSDRTFKSGESWSWPFADEIMALDWREDYNAYGSNFEIYMINIKSKNLIRLTDNKTFDSFPVFSKNGKSRFICYSR